MNLLEADTKILQIRAVTAVSTSILYMLRSNIAFQFHRSRGNHHFILSSFSGNKRKKKRSMSLSVDSREEIYRSSTPYDEYSSSSCILFFFFQGEGSLIAGVYDDYLLSESFPAFRLALYLSHTERDKFLVSREG